MAELTPAKTDINVIFKRLRSAPANKQCFDCRASNPTWASVTYGVFLCIDCSAVHRSLGVHLTFIRSTQLDTSWTWLQLRAMQMGGNQNAASFFRQHGCSSDDAQQKYNSRAAHMYREKLHSLASRAMQTHGTKLHIHAHEEAVSPPATEKEIDFFKEHENEFKMRQELHATAEESLCPSEPVPVTNGRAVQRIAAEEDGVGPNVEHALGTSPTTAMAQAEPRKVTIGGRKPGAKKGGLGGKKGLGAQRVKTDFKQIESDAQQRDKDREEIEANRAVMQVQSQQDEEKRMASVRLAYKDMEIDRKKAEARMKDMDPKKREQMERLGMGFAGPRKVEKTETGATHSVLSDMKVIEQETPVNDRYTSRHRNDFDDDFEIVSNSFSGPPKYNDSPFGIKREDRYSSWGNDKSSSWGNDKSSSWGNEKKSSWDMDRFESSSSSHTEDIPRKTDDEDRGRSRKTYEVSSSNDAQKKFGNAKAISSDQFFGNKDADYEMKQSLQRFEGSSSISSADLFGNGQTRSNMRSEGTDLAEIREGVRQGVTKVAGKLSNLANGVITSIQDNYS